LARAASYASGLASQGQLEIGHIDSIRSSVSTISKKYDQQEVRSARKSPQSGKRRGRIAAGVKRIEKPVFREEPAPAPVEPVRALARLFKSGSERSGGLQL
jgi:hypothetical protein